MRRVTSCVCALLLAACASPPPAPSSGWAGKLGYQVDASADRRAQAGSALFELQGNEQSGQIQLNSPLGTALAHAGWGRHGAWLDDGQRRREFADLDALGLALGEALQGPALPLRALFDWLAGQPHAAHPHLTGPEGFEQLGWQVLRQAQSLTLSRPAQGGQGAIRLRILLSTSP